MAEPRGAHLVGSVPLADEEAVFRAVAGTLGRHVRRIPDGETGPRAMWISYQLDRLASLPWFEVRPNPLGAEELPPVLFLREGVSAADVDFGPLGYVEPAIRSYQTFERLAAEGVIPDGCRFMVAAPTPLANSWAWLGFNNDFDELDRRYEAAMRREVEAIVEAIPHDRLAWQWDVCVEVWLWEGWVQSQLADAHDELPRKLGWISNWIPEDVELGVHYCYGDYNHEHMRQPDDTRNLVALANAHLACTTRSVQFVHVPVPIERDDGAYFEPLRDLNLPESAELYLGLLHYRDGQDGAHRRIATATHTLDREFGVATECGLGRRPPERGGTTATLSTLLDLHAATATPVR